MKALAPEHLDDLRKSGLSDETISALEAEAVRPHDIKLHGVESAYRLNYYDLDGNPTCVERWKLFPSIKGPDGTQKYHQAPGTPPALYIPPLISWKVVARDASLPIIVTEGEKKAAAGCQVGLHVLGVAGVWSWRRKLDTGERLTLPALDQITWEGRAVELVPDSDVWKKEKFAALCGFYALAKELASRGADVRFVVLQSSGQGKIGMDDWLVQAGTQWKHYWPSLDRAGLDHARLNAVAAWWQKWREKQETQQAFRDRVADDLILTETLGLYTVRSGMHALTLEFDSLHIHGTGVIAELSVMVEDRELRDHINHNLKSDTAHTSLAKSLHAVLDNIPWKVLLPRACALVLKRFRQGAPIVRIDKHSVAERLSFIVNPLVMKNKPTILYANGGHGKSMLALFIALLVSTGGSHAGLSTIKGKSLYCDFEDDEPVFINRRHALHAGHPELADGFIDYLPCTQPLARMTQTLARTVQREGITFLVIDSLLKAAGGGSDAEATENLFAALRILNVATLIIGHTPKPQADGPSAPSIYGSVFSGNFARSVWEFQLEAEPGEDSSLISLVNHKTNLSKKHLPVGLKITYEAEGTRVRYEAHDVKDSTELKQSLPIPSQIRNLLEDGILRTAKQIAEELGISRSKVKSPLSKYVGHKWMAIPTEGHDTQYTVLNPQRGGGA